MTKPTISHTMTTPNQSHVAGLKLALDRWNDGGPSIQFAHLLTELIAQAEAAPAEPFQKPTLLKECNVRYSDSSGGVCRSEYKGGPEQTAEPTEAVDVVGVVYTMEALVPGGSVKSHARLNRELPAGTKLYCRY